MALLATVEVAGLAPSAASQAPADSPTRANRSCPSTRAAAAAAVLGGFGGGIVIRGGGAGAGGGALELGALGHLTVSGELRADGGDGDFEAGGSIRMSGGGGSGGGLRLHGGSADLTTATLFASGGSAPAASVRGGGGAGGYIAVLLGSGTTTIGGATVSGGTGASSGEPGSSTMGTAAASAPATLDLVMRLGDGPVTAPLEVSNTGDALSLLYGVYDATSPPFSGGGVSFSGVTGGASTTTDFSFDTETRQSVQQGVEITTNASLLQVTLEASAVGPQAMTSGAPGESLDFGFVDPLDSSTLAVTITNSTPDGDLEALTDLTVLSAQISGSGAALFEVDDGSLPTAIAAGGSIMLDVTYSPTTVGGPDQAILTISTDENAPLGQAGDDIVIALRGVSDDFVFADGFESGNLASWELSP